jgi:hypothetical protein
METNPAKRRCNAATCDTAVLQRFVDAVLKVEPVPEKEGETVVRAFIDAGLDAELQSAPPKQMAGSRPAMISSS